MNFVVLRGHGTQPVNEELLATVCGVVERVNKLVSVRPLRARYCFERFSITIFCVVKVKVTVMYVFIACLAFNWQLGVSMTWLCIYVL